MKTQPKKLLRILSVFLICITACGKDSSLQQKDVNGNINIASIRVIENEDTIELLSDLNQKHNKIKLASSGLAEHNPESKYIIHEHSEFDYIINLEANTTNLNGRNSIADSSPNNSGIKRSSKSHLQAVDQDLPLATKFRLIIYHQNQKSSPVYNAILQKWQNPNITLEAGKSYDWYAYSIGSISPPDIEDTEEVLPKSEIGNKDFMYVKGNLDVTPGQNFLNIIFKRQTSRVQINLNTRGIFGPMHNNSALLVGEINAGVFNNIIKAGDFNIFTGQYANMEDAAPGLAIDATNMSTNWNNEEKLFNFYTALNTDKVILANRLAVQINALSITLDDNSTRTFSPNTIVPINHNTSLTLKKGSSMRSNVRLIESAILVNGVRWARTNLVYDASRLVTSSYNPNFSNAYRMKPSNNYSLGAANEYWNYLTAFPNQTENVNVLQCYRIYPEYTWRAPVNSQGVYQFDQLVAAPHTYDVSLMPDGGYRHSYVWQGEGPNNPAYPDNNKLILNFLGRRVNGVIQDNPRSSPNAAGGLYLQAGYHTSYDGYVTIVPYIFTSEKPANNAPNGFTFEQSMRFDGHGIRCIR